MTKTDRQKVYDKYKGKCAYCGCLLEKGWHVDELLPVRRLYDNKWNTEKRKWDKVFIGYEHPERMNIKNQNPACASCNINKHSMSLEEFRQQIKGFMKHLNEVSTQFKIAKRYCLVRENDIPVIFYFEALEYCNPHSITNH